MRRLILLRHAKAERREGVPDTDRALDARGRAASTRMGAYLAAEGLAPDHVLVSPARRTLETWAGVRADLPGIEAETVPALYDAPASRVLDAVRACPEAARSCLVIGHNPGVKDLAGLLAGHGSQTLRDAMGARFPTAALAVLDFAVEDWSGIGPGGGRLERFVSPKGLVAGASR